MAARQALTKQLSVAEVPWLVLATDGAYRPMQMLSLDRWTQVSGCDSGELARLLEECHRWEAESDPTGATFPRAKRHDDNTLVTVRTP